MKKIILSAILIVSICAFGFSQNRTIGIHGGAGTDINLGLGIGAGVTYLLTELVGFDMEVGAYLFYSYTVDSYVENNNHYTETTSMFIFAVLDDVLFGYKPEEAGVFFIAGLGAMAASIDWQIRSPDDSSANFDNDGITGGLLTNLGLGITLGGGFEIRIQAPVFIVFAPYRVVFAPMFVAMAGFRF